MKGLKKLLAGFLFSALVTAGVACGGFSATTAGDENVPEISQSAPLLRVETVASNLEVPWSIAFAPDGRVFFTERPGRLRVIENGVLRAAPLAVIQDVEPTGESGLMGMALHPRFAENRFLYLAYAYNADGARVKVVRYRETGGGLADAVTIIQDIPAGRYHAGTRLGFSPADGKLYVTTGDATRQSIAQDLSSLGGKTLRLNDDGTIPPDNPFVNQPGARPEIWTYGHRNAQGLAWQPGTLLMWQTEHGPSLIDGVSLSPFKRRGGDEVNIVERGKNYGWAKISHNSRREGMETPVVQFTPAVAPASAMFYDAALFPEFRGNFFFGALRGEAIVRLVIDGRKVVNQERLFKETYGRIREVAQAPDGSIYFSTSNRDGRGRAAKDDDRILRVVPAAGR